MYRPLVPCPSCQRHVLTSEAGCPFCGAALPRDLDAAVIPAAKQRLSRAAAFVFTTSLAVTGCGSTVTDGGTDDVDASSSSTGPDDDGGAMAEYGAPVDAGPGDDGGMMALYGVAADGGPDDDGGAMAEYGAPVDDGGGSADYGAPPDDGGAEPLYGAAPPPPPQD